MITGINKETLMVIFEDQWRGKTYDKFKNMETNVTNFILKKN